MISPETIQDGLGQWRHLVLLSAVPLPDEYGDTLQDFYWCVGTLMSRVYPRTLHVIFGANDDKGNFAIPNSVKGGGKSFILVRMDADQFGTSWSPGGPLFLDVAKIVPFPPSTRRALFMHELVHCVLGAHDEHFTNEIARIFCPDLVTVTGPSGYPHVFTDPSARRELPMERGPLRFPTGMLAMDVNGKIIHDIADYAIAADTVPLGHPALLTAAGWLDNYSYGVTSTDINGSSSSGRRNVNVSSFLPSGLTNVKGLIIYVFGVGTITLPKITSTCGVYIQARYSTQYDTDPGTNNVLVQQDHIAPVAGYGYSSLGGTIRTSFGLIPVFWVSGVPYITWDVFFSFYLMGGANGSYSASAYLRLIGWTA